MSGNQDEIVIQSPEWGQRLGTSLLHMQERGLLCDVQLYATCAQPAQPVPVHGCVLGACSTILSTLVQGTPNRQLHMTVDQSTLGYLIAFCYTGRVSIRRHELQTVHRAAVEYGVKELQTLCVDFLDKEPHKEPMSTVNASLRFEPGISAPMATSQLPILSKIEGLDTFESSQELTFDVHFPGEPTNSPSEHPKTTEIPSAPPKVAAPQESFLCTECGKIFDKLVNLQMHEKRHKTENSGVTFTCQLCEKVFKSKQNLQVHSKKHADEKAFQCAYCAKRFVRKTELTMHERIHTGERPYTCKYCSKSFAQSTNLQDHERTHTGAKPYACDRCDATFSNSSNLRRHKKFHDRRLALGLPQQLRQKNDQMRILPTGEKIYPCKMCDKHFKRLRNLEDHLRTHTGEKPFKCSMCQRGFARQPNLIRHEKFHKKKQSQGVKESKSKPITKTTSETVTNELITPPVGTNNLMNFPSVNAQQPPGYEPSQNVFLATDTTSLATKLHQIPSSVPLLVRPVAQSTTTVSELGEIVPLVSSSVPMGTVSCTSVSHTDSSVSNVDMFSATAVTSTFTACSLPAVNSAVLPCQSAVPPGCATFMNSGSITSRAISLPEPSSQVSSSMPHSISLVNCPMSTSRLHSVPSYLNSISLIPLPATFPHAVSHSITSVPQSISSVPQSIFSIHPISSVPQSVSSVPQTSVPDSLSSVPQTSVPHSISAVPHSIAKSSVLSANSSVDPNLSAGSSSTFPDPLAGAGYFGPGGFMAQLEGAPFPQTINTSPLYLQPNTGESGSNHQQLG